ncbi:MAG: dephospho-CoA kinase [Acidiphilium sp.]|nr:dephospho-CoA kinase [Acidiphilium sp.]MDD4935888.1 dephospho-CoA kinase [Acidiphilium sp.]
MKIIGLTGGIGMGKSTAAAVFRRHKIPVFDADATVRALQVRHGVAIPPIAAAFPDVVHDGALDRAALRACILADPDAKRHLEAIMHRLVRAKERQFLARARRRRVPMVVLDIPLLFETGAERRVDVALTVSAPKSVQRARVRRRGLKDPEIATIVALQMSDREKRRHADAVIPTGLSRNHMVRTVERLIRAIARSSPAPARRRPRR